MKQILSILVAALCAASLANAQTPAPSPAASPTPAPTPAAVAVDRGDFQAKPEMIKGMTLAEARKLGQIFAKAKQAQLSESAGPADAQGREHHFIDFSFNGTPNPDWEGSKFRLDVAVQNGKVAEWELITWTGKGIASRRANQIGIIKTMLEGYQEEVRLTPAQRKANAKEDLVDSYRVVIISNWPGLNFVKVASNGNSIVATHALFSRYSFAAGAGGRAVQKWVGDHFDELKEAGIKKVGVQSPSGSSAWFDVK